MGTHTHTHLPLPRRRAHLSEPLQVQDEDVRQRPQAELDAALLQLLAVGAAPGVVGGQLEHTVQVSANTTRPRVPHPHLTVEITHLTQTAKLR